jgi:formylglycine-generating enzyme required for sulfatase activity
MKHLFFLLLLCLGSSLMAQDKETEATFLYEKATASYESGDYSASVKWLDRAELILGSTNAAIAYYRVKNSLVLDSRATIKQYIKLYFAQKRRNKSWDNELLELKYALPEMFLLGDIATNMVKVKGGSFMMGCTSEQKDCHNDENVHQVTLSSYKMAKYEVTQAQWEAVMGKNPSYHKNCSTCPVEEVSWDDIQDFLKELNKKTGKKYRLPTEAEWEYAARGGKNREYQYSGSGDIDKVAWYGENSGSKIHKVGQKEPNKLGLYDMSGNVYEWCSDWYGDYTSSSATNPKGASSGSYRVNRGGSYYYYAEYCRVADRGRYSPDFRGNNIGFRLAL